MINDLVKLVESKISLEMKIKKFKDYVDDKNNGSFFYMSDSDIQNIYKILTEEELVIEKDEENE